MSKRIGYEEKGEVQNMTNSEKRGRTNKEMKPAITVRNSRSDNTFLKHPIKRLQTC